MIRSMTAFARQDSKTDFGAMTWELRSVNHRYLEISLRLPEEFRRMETTIRELVGNYLQRGKIECNFTLKQEKRNTSDAVLNLPVVHHVLGLSQQLSHISSDIDPLCASDILKWPGVLESPELDLDLLGKEALALLKTALKEMVDTREREGDKLAQAIRERLDFMKQNVIDVRTRLPGILDEVRGRLRKRFDELSVQVDSDRLEQEMVFLTQKSDVEEELKRLEMHISEVESIINTGNAQGVGRRLDFLMQELNREANTLCSKSMDSETTKAGIDLKVYIEQIREQVQNIE